MLLVSMRVRSAVLELLVGDFVGLSSISRPSQRISVSGVLELDADSVMSLIKASLPQH